MPPASHQLRNTVLYNTELHGISLLNLCYLRLGSSVALSTSRLESRCLDRTAPHTSSSATSSKPSHSRQDEQCFKMGPLQTPTHDKGRVYTNAGISVGSKTAHSHVLGKSLYCRSHDLQSCAIRATLSMSVQTMFRLSELSSVTMCRHLFLWSLLYEHFMCY
jgi:hypothetical protein